MFFGQIEEPARAALHIDEVTQSNRIWMGSGLGPILKNGWILGDLAWFTTMCH